MPSHPAHRLNIHYGARAHERDRFRHELTTVVAADK